MEKAYKFRIYPTVEQTTLIQKTFGCCRYVYNYFLARRKRVYEEQQTTLGRFACGKELTELKRQTEWLREPDKNAFDYVLRDLDQAYKNFFRELKKGNLAYPKFKSKKESAKTYTTKFFIHIKGDYIQLPKLGKVRCKFSRQVQGRILNATVSQQPSGKYYVSITCTDVEIPQLPKTGKSVGIDLGIKSLITTSDGEHIDNPKYLEKAQKRLARLQRQLSRKSKDSKRWEKARVKVARAYEKVHNQRTDYLQKLSTDLIRNYDTICLEHLNIQGMQKNHKLAKAVSSAAWNELTQQLAYKAKWYGKTIQQVDTFYASSQICSECGAVNREVKDLDIRQWTCPCCGAEHDRDVNAAKNILHEGQRLLATA